MCDIIKQQIISFSYFKIPFITNCPTVEVNWDRFYTT